MYIANSCDVRSMSTFIDSLCIKLSARLVQPDAPTRLLCLFRVMGKSPNHSSHCSEGNDSA
jgi:hypothetical protein